MREGGGGDWEMLQQLHPTSAALPRKIEYECNDKKKANDILVLVPVLASTSRPSSSTSYLVLVLVLRRSPAWAPD